MADETKPRAARRARKAAPTTADPIEIAMEAEAGDRSDDSPARRKSCAGIAGCWTSS